MRIMLKVQVPNEGGNKAIVEGRMEKIMGGFLEEWKPEAAYFTLDEGERTAYFFVNLDDPSDMPKLGERFFMDLGARIDMTPAMSPEDLQKGLSKLR